ncbi:type II toxin-antitoxin system VapC family toxin [Thermus thermamylovorans]|uniref:PIN domain-containing protein n=1 Tax=Thermus thermamylovorans TaxID=2509362 RepID=A0A4Q9AVY9_9DEIN|nr:type II toxin-antitoxin system VapC family toxin [Thermus thermamylovorans]TBH14887.1 PIN domain-containing protein [Thermus thermamylovorans]
MVVDFSVLRATLFQEEGHEALLQAIQGAPRAALGAPTLVETAVVFGRRVGFEQTHLVERLLEELGLEVLPLTKEPYREAVWAHARYGKGRHPAGLNLGDCLSYAVTRVEGEPLRYKGEDFRKTDLGQG